MNAQREQQCSVPRVVQGSRIAAFVLLARDYGPEATAESAREIPGICEKKSMHSVALGVAPVLNCLGGGPAHVTAGNLSLLISPLSDGPHSGQEDEEFNIFSTQPVALLNKS